MVHEPSMVNEEHSPSESYRRAIITHTQFKALPPTPLLFQHIAPLTSLLPLSLDPRAPPATSAASTGAWACCDRRAQ